MNYHKGHNMESTTTANGTEVIETRAMADAERREREADKRHVANVKSKAAAAMMGIGGIEAKTAAAVVEAIAEGNIPAVTIRC
jgi:hypothetical protein